MNALAAKTMPTMPRIVPSHPHDENTQEQTKATMPTTSAAVAVPVLLEFMGADPFWWHVTILAAQGLGAP